MKVKHIITKLQELPEDLDFKFFSRSYTGDHEELIVETPILGIAEDTKSTYKTAFVCPISGDFFDDVLHDNDSDSPYVKHFSIRLMP